MKTQMTTYCMTPFIRNSRKGKTIVIRPGVAGGGEEKKTTQDTAKVLNVSLDNHPGLEQENNSKQRKKTL